MAMNITAAFAELDALVKRFETLLGQAEDADASWLLVNSTIRELNAEAKRLLLPWGSVQQKTTSLRGHLGALLGKRPSYGRPMDQHASWARIDLSALRSWSCFGPALDREARGALHADDHRTIQ